MAFEGYVILVVAFCAGVALGAGSVWVWLAVRAVVT